MARAATMVRVRLEEARELQKLIASSSAARQEALRSFVYHLKGVTDDDERPELIKKARELHCKNDEDVEVDDDAPFSDVEEGTWVGAWLYVRKGKD